MKKRTGAIVALVMSLSLVLSACGGSKQTNGTQTGGSTTSDNITSAKDTLVVGTSTDPATFNPYEAYNSFNQRILPNILEPLYDVDKDGNAYPVLAKDYKADADGLGATVSIPKGVLFHDGTEAKANDVLYSLKSLVKGPSAAAVAFIDINNCKVVDDYTVDIRTKFKSSQIIQALTTCYLVSEKDMEKKGKQAGQSMIGTGPFMMDKYVSGDSVTLKRFDKYWGKKPAIQTLKFRFISETSVELIELQTGGIDVALDVMGKDVDKVKNDSNSKYQVITTKGDMNNYLGFNCSKAPFNDIRMRQAVAYAIDKEAIIKSSYQGLGMVGTSIMANMFFGHVDQQYPEYNPEKAKQLIKEAGYPNGLEITLAMDEQPYRKATTEQLIDMFANVGIKLKVVTHDFATNTQIITGTNDYNIFLRGLGGNPGEVLGNMLILTSAAQGYPGGQNPTKTKGIPEAEAIDKLLDKASQTVDPNERKAVYADIQKAHAQQLFQVPIQVNTSPIMMSKKLKGIWVSGVITHYAGAYFEK